MARIRSQHPGIFTDEAYMTLSFAARELLRGLWAQADDQGVFDWKPMTLKVRIFPADTVDLDALLAELAAANFIHAYQVEGRRFGAVRNFMKYQRPRKPSYVHPLPDELRGYVGMPGAEPVPHRYGTGTVLPPQREEEGKEGEKEEEKEEGGKREQEEEAQAAAAAAASAPAEDAAALVTAFHQERATLWPGSGASPTTTAPPTPAEAATAARVLATAARLGLSAGQVRGEARAYLRMRLTALRDKGRPPPATLTYFQAALLEHLPTCAGGGAGTGAGCGAAAALPRGRKSRGMTGEEADRAILSALGLDPSDPFDPMPEA